MKCGLVIVVFLLFVAEGCSLEHIGPVDFTGIASIVYNPNNPVVTVGDGGAFDGAAIQDMKILRTHGTQPHEYYMFYTGAAISASPYNPTVGIAHSDDGLVWTKDGQAIPAHGACGGAFSPGAYYDYAGTGTLYVYVSCTAKAEQWYTGPINIYSLIVSSGKSWTNRANYVWQSGPSLTATQSWEGTQGVYAPEVVKIGSTYTLFYSSATSGGGKWNIGLATSGNPLGPWTKFSGNPITASGVAEEPAIAQLDNGGLMMFSDTLAFNLGRGVSIYTTASLSGQVAPWTWNFVQWGDAGTWDGNHVGSQSILEMPDGRWLLAWGGNSGDADQIGTAIVTFRTNLSYILPFEGLTFPGSSRGGLSHRWPARCFVPLYCQCSATDKGHDSSLLSVVWKSGKCSSPSAFACPGDAWVSHAAVGTL